MSNAYYEINDAEDECICEGEFKGTVAEVKAKALDKFAEYDNSAVINLFHTAAAYTMCYQDGEWKETVFV